MNESLEKKIDRANAVHEAGHAVAVLACGGSVGYVSIADDPFSKFDFGGCFRSALDDRSSLIVKMAGIGAEILFRHCT
ncbi:MAG: hypothetical protein WB566_05710, partial [Terriglobales bacterium]